MMADRIDSRFLRPLVSLHCSGVLFHMLLFWKVHRKIAVKKNGTPRICVDFRSLNARTKKDAKSIPRISDMLEFGGWLIRYVLWKGSLSNKI